jgi:hypothetical protein
MSCLLSKLNGEVDNALLPKIGELILHIENQLTTFKSPNCFRIWPNVNVPISVEVIGEGSLSQSADGSNPFTSKTFSTSTVQGFYFYVSPGTYDVKFSNKYAMSMEYVPPSCTNDITDFIYVKGNRRVVFGVRSASAVGDAKITGTLSDFTKLKQELSGISCDYCQNITGDLTDLISIDNTHFFNLGLNTARNITGDIKVLGHFMNLTATTLSSQNLTGDLTEMFDAMHANGRTNGTCAASISSSGPTYNGEHPSRMTTYTATFSESGWTLQS